MKAKKDVTKPRNQYSLEFRVRRSSRIRHGTSKSPGVLGPARWFCFAGPGRPAAERRHSDSTPREARLPGTTRHRFALPGAQRKKQALERAGKDGVTATARDLNLNEGQLYAWRQKQRLEGLTTEDQKLQQGELARLKRELAQMEEEIGRAHV